MTNKQIEQLAENLARKYNPQSLAPFPFEKVQDDAKNLQIWLVGLADNLSGAIGFDSRNNLFDIYVDKDELPTRRQFTLAHEFGHYYLHQNIVKKDELLVDDDHSLETIHKNA